MAVPRRHKTSNVVSFERLDQPSQQGAQEPLKQEEVLDSERWQVIENAALEVWRVLGYGFCESVYVTALLHELEKQGIGCALDYLTPIWYDGVQVGEVCVTILVDGGEILLIKAEEVITAGHMAEAINQLMLTNRQWAIVVNFEPDKVELRRVIL